jgi:hypothetical protein
MKSSVLSFLFVLFFSPSAHAYTYAGSNGENVNSANFKSALSLGNVENTALSTWTGTSNLTTLGIIGTGTWRGSVIVDNYISSAATWNAKQSAITFGTGVQTSLGVAIGSAGAPVLFNGAGGTPSSIVLTNATGTASSLTAGTVSSIGNLTGVVTSSNRATAIADSALSIAKTSGLQTALDGKSDLLFSGRSTIGWTKGTAGTTGNAGEQNELLISNNNPGANVIAIQNTATTNPLSTFCFRDNNNHEKAALGYANVTGFLDTVFLECSDIDNATVSTSTSPQFRLLMTTSYGGAAGFYQYQRFGIDADGRLFINDRTAANAVLTVGATDGVLTLNPATYTRLQRRT